MMSPVAHLNMIIGCLSIGCSSSAEEDSKYRASGSYKYSHCICSKRQAGITHTALEANSGASCHSMGDLEDGVNLPQKFNPGRDQVTSHPFVPFMSLLSFLSFHTI